MADRQIRVKVESRKEKFSTKKYEKLSPSPPHCMLSRPSTDPIWSEIWDKQTTQTINNTINDTFRFLRRVNKALSVVFYPLAFPLHPQSSHKGKFYYIEICTDKKQTNPNDNTELLFIALCIKKFWHCFHITKTYVFCKSWHWDSGLIHSPPRSVGKFCLCWKFKSLGNLGGLYWIALSRVSAACIE